MLDNRGLSDGYPNGITPENSEAYVRRWLDAFELGTTKVVDPNVYFGFGITSKDGGPLNVARTKKHDHYLTIASIMVLGPEHRSAFDKLLEAEQAQILKGLTLEMSKAKIGYAIEPPLKQIFLEKRVPITSNLSEAEFISAIQDLNFAQILVNTTIDLELKRIAGKHETIESK